VDFSIKLGLLPFIDDWPFGERREFGGYPTEFHVESRDRVGFSGQF
jgi:hypothetical protein